MFEPFPKENLYWPEDSEEDDSDTPRSWSPVIDDRYAPLREKIKPVEPMNLLLLPYLPLLKVFRYLDDKSLIRVHLLCKFLRRFVVENRLRLVESPFDRLYLDQIASRDGLAPPLLLVTRRITLIYRKNMCERPTRRALSFREPFFHLFRAVFDLIASTLSMAMEPNEGEPIKRFLKKRFSIVEWLWEPKEGMENHFGELDYEELFSTIKFRVGDVNGTSTSSRIDSKKKFVTEIEPKKEIDEKWRFVTDSMREHYKNLKFYS